MTIKRRGDWKNGSSLAVNGRYFEKENIKCTSLESEDGISE